MAGSIFEQVKLNYVLPNFLIFASMIFHLINAIIHPQILLSNFELFRTKSFATLWKTIGGIFAVETHPTVTKLLSSSKGLILDVGPGGGDQIFRFSHPENIQKIYGIEPGIDLHSKILIKAEKAGLGKGKYEVLGCGAQPEELIPALSKKGIIKSTTSSGSGGKDYEIFDEIVCLRVLCGVPKPEETIRSLYKLLKSGGRFVIFEHVINSGNVKLGGTSTGLNLQNWYTKIGWTFWLGDCELRRDTIKSFDLAAKSDGGWAEKKIELIDGWSCIPHVVGYFVKK